MTKAELIKLVDGAPFTLEEVAYAMSEVSDDEELSDAGYAYIQAERRLFELLEENGVELG